MNETLKSNETVVGDASDHLEALNDVERKRMFFVSRLCKKDYDSKSLLNAIVDTIINDNITDAVVLYPEPSQKDKYINPIAITRIREVRKELKGLDVALRLHLVSLSPSEFKNYLKPGSTRR